MSSMDDEDDRTRRVVLQRWSGKSEDINKGPKVEGRRNSVPKAVRVRVAALPRRGWPARRVKRVSTSFDSGKFIGSELAFIRSRLKTVSNEQSLCSRNCLIQYRLCYCQGSQLQPVHQNRMYQA